MKLLNPRKISSKLTMTTSEQHATHAGQMYLAGTGPAGMTCRQCIHWLSGLDYDAHGQLKAAPCALAKKHFKSNKRNTKAPDVPQSAASCKYFEFNNNAPKPFKD